MDLRRFGRPVALIGVAVLLIVIGALVTALLFPATVNQATRIDASQHVSNLPCGSGQYVAAGECPGALVCASDPRGYSQDAFREGRVGATGTEHAYCVTPVFTERYCGLLRATTGIFQSGARVEQTYHCSDSYHLAGVIQRLQDDPLSILAQIFDTDGRGSAWIYEQDLTLLKDDPDSSEISLDGYIHCNEADLRITGPYYGEMKTTATFTITNTGTIPLPNATLTVLEDDTTTEYRTPSINASDQINHTVEVDGSVAGAIGLPYCNHGELDNTLEDRP